MTLVKGRSTLPRTKVPVDVDAVKARAAAVVTLIGSLVGLAVIGLMLLAIVRGAA